jgi:hypothetical protein
VTSHDQPWPPTGGQQPGQPGAWGGPPRPQPGPGTGGFPAGYPTSGQSPHGAPPGQPGPAGQPAYPAQPGLAGQPAHPAQPGPADQPAYPGQPGSVAQPGPAGQPGYPAQPGLPGYPGVGPQPGYGTPGYGTPPGQPGFGGPYPPPRPSGRKRGPWLWLAPVLVLIVAAAITVPLLSTGGGGGGAAAGPGPNGGSAPAHPMRSWQAVAHTMASYTQGLGERVYGDDLVLVTDTRLTAFARDTGAQAWTLTPPGANTGICALSRNLGHGQLAIGYGPVGSTGISCTSTALVDLATHSFVWSKPVPQFSVDGDAPSGQGLVFAGNNLYAGAKTALVRMSLSDGTAQALGPGFQSGADPCYADDLSADAGTVYVLGNCIGDNTYTALLELDAASGAMRANTTIRTGDAKLPTDGTGGTGINGAQFVSTSPLVLMLYSDVNASSFYGAFVRLDNSLKVSWSSVQQQGATGALDTTEDSVSIADAAHQFDRAFVADGSLFAVTTFQNSNGVPDANKVVALDVDTGRQRWATGVPGDSMCDPVGVDGDTLLVAGDQLWTGDINNPATVLAKLDVRSGKVLSTKSQSNPIEGARSGVTLPADEAMDDIAWAVADGRVYGDDQNKVLDPGYPVAFSLG